MKMPFTNKTENVRRRRQKPGFWSTLLGSPNEEESRLSANVTREEDWDVDVPEIKMSRAFVIMLVLHIVAIGGLVAFNFWGKDEAAEAPLAGTADPIPAGMESVGTAAEEQKQRTHTFQSGETMALIAARYNVPVMDLESANVGRLTAPGVQLFIPRSPRYLEIADVPSTGPDPLAPPTELATNAPAEDEAPQEVSADGGNTPAADTTNALAENAVAKVTGAKVSITNPQITSQPTAAVAKNSLRDDAAAERAKAKEAAREREEANQKVIAERASRLRKEQVKNTKVEKVVKQEKAVKPTKAEQKPAGQRTHVVSKGDTVFNIARRYGCTPAEVGRLNGIGANSHIGVGQILKVPVKR